EIPEEALDELVGWGFTSLWLIGIWERSQASQSIKQRMGNPEAAASAYSLFDYQVAADLGGDAALDTLQQRCETLGLRLACDVVPNHTGIDSRWMREHPDWFLQSAHPPYPDYHFDGPDLSNDPAFGLFIEDGYWQRRNAAVVFKHLDRTNGQVRYIYHGNDGTHLPWNDTAQLNFLLPQVREAMIETILHVARRFRVIRFDAAMTLARKHYQRLWFPLPGASGVPSRAEQTISQERFAELFPQEFWREVVDRVAQEVPDTLLLAEAFWLMEGYFVRTLGMHRVYNSAFMNMLKNEENGRYHETLRNILAANPQILKRFVNFMNNPDEETAVAQFGKSEKYFGVATLLATMPGLPMFGHGQIEGFEEKYGMEYRRAYRDETPDAEFIAEHARRIFPLLRRRDLFSDVEQFTLYEARQSSGSPLEDLFAYSNRHGEERALILYHNRQGNVSGRIEPHSLGFPIEENHYLRCRELVSGRDYLFATTELQRDGFLFRLGPYQAAVYLDWQLLIDHDGSWGELCTELGGHGCDDLDRARLRQQSRPLIEPLLALLDAENLALILDALAQGVLSEALLDGAERFYTPLQQRHGRPVGELGRQLQNDLETLLKLQTLSGRNPQERRLLARLNLTSRLTDPQQLRLLVIWLLLRPLEQLAPGINGFDLYPLQEALATRLEEPESELPLMRLLWRHPNLFAPGHSLPGSLKRVLRDPFGARYLRIHPHDGRTWFDRERFETLLPYLALIATFSALDFFGSEEKEFMLHLQQCQTYLDALPSEAEKAGYNLDKFQARLW
ncbi:MAG: alpha-amylase, partial [Desulfuromonas sp.]